MSHTSTFEGPGGSGVHERPLRARRAGGRIAHLFALAREAELLVPPDSWRLLASRALGLARAFEPELDLAEAFAALGAEAAGPEREARALALACAAARRGLGQEPREEQILAALGAAEGFLVQLDPGEGKTLAVFLSAALLLSRGRRAHVLEANAYLAERNRRWMGPAFACLGLEPALAVQGAAGPSSWAAPVVYAELRAAGLAYLRDGLARAPSERSGLVLDAAILDEADAILLDESDRSLALGRLAAPDAPPFGPAAAELLAPEEAARLASNLREGRDYRLEPASRRVRLLPGALRALEARLEGAQESEGIGARARLLAALRAEHAFERGRDYLVRGDRLLPLDPRTGRPVPGGRWAWGLHAALEAKEGLEPGPEAILAARMGAGDFARSHPLVGGFGASLAPAAEELRKGFGLRVLLIPRRAPCRRRDREPLVFRSAAERDAALAAAAGQALASGRPVLVAAESAAAALRLAGLLRGAGREPRLVLPGNEAEEREAFEAAGRAGALTIAVAHAGRGVDIVPGAGGSPGEGEAVEAAGGLLVLGQGLRESERLELQLRGRTARGGAAGEYACLLSLEDELFRRFGSPALLPGATRRALRAGAAGPLPGGAALLRAFSSARLVGMARRGAERARLRERETCVELQRRLVRSLRDEILDEAASGRAALLAFLARIDAAWEAQLERLEELREGLALRERAGVEGGRAFLRDAWAAFEEELAPALEAAARGLAEASASEGPGAGAAVAPALRLVPLLEEDRSPRDEEESFAVSLASLVAGLGRRLAGADGHHGGRRRAGLSDSAGEDARSAAAPSESASAEVAPSEAAPVGAGAAAAPAEAVAWD